MPSIVVAQRMWQRRDTAANWTAKNPILAAGEIGVELGATDSAAQKFKIGNGTTPWTALAYGGGGGGGTWLNGTGVPGPALGNDGDYYLRTTTGDVYAKTSGAWDIVANITGPAGTAGSRWYNGTGVPAAGLGVNGDYYLRTTTNDVYAKASGSWSVVGNFQGSPGPKGDTGDQGVPGVPGPSSHCFPVASFSGGAGEIEVGAAQSLYVPFGFTITSAALIADRVGTVQIDIRKTSFATYPPSSLNSICGGAPPTLSNVDKAIVSDLSLWDVDVAAGDTLQFICTACVGIKAATLTLTGFRS